MSRYLVIILCCCLSILPAIGLPADAPIEAPAPDGGAAIIPPAALVLPPAVDSAPKEDDPLVDTVAWPLWAETAWERTSDVLHDHLRVGVRYRQVRLTDSKRSLDNSFLGSITELNEQRDYDALTWLTFEWLANPYAGLRFNWEQVRAQTSTTSYDNHSDGNIDLMGPQLSLLLRLPNQTRLTPTAGIGYAWLTSTFEHNPTWYNGFGGTTKQADYDAWVAAGSPPWPNHGYRREILLDDTTALILTAGLEIRLTDHLDFNIFVQNMEVQEVGVTYNLSFGGNVFESQEAKFPMSNVGYGAGLRWTF